MMEFRLAPYEARFLSSVIRCYTAAVHHISDAYYSSAERIAWAPDTPDVNEWARNLGAGKVMLAIDSGAEVLGFSDVLLPQKKINRLYVHPEAQGQGIGKLLLAAAEQEILQSGYCSVLRLESTLNARGFYERHGYVCIGQRRVVFNGMPYSNWLMEKQIFAR